MMPPIRVAINALIACGFSAHNQINKSMVGQRLDVFIQSPTVVLVSRKILFCDFSIEIKALFASHFFPNR